MNIDRLKINKFFDEQLKQREIPSEVANSLISALINASLMGIDSHGVNLFSHYLDCIDNGRINPHAKIEMRKVGSTVICNANENFSHHAAQSLIHELAEVSENTGVNCEPGVPNIVNLPSTESGEERCRTESSVSFPSTYNLCVSSTIHSTKPASHVWSSALVLIVPIRIVKSKRAEKATAFTLLIAIPHRSSSIKKLWSVYQKNTQFNRYEHKNIPQVIDKAFTVPFVRKPLFSSVAPRTESI